MSKVKGHHIRETQRELHEQQFHQQLYKNQPVHQRLHQWPLPQDRKKRNLKFRTQVVSKDRDAGNKSTENHCVTNKCVRDHHARRHFISSHKTGDHFPSLTVRSPSETQIKIQLNVTWHWNWENNVNGSQKVYPMKTVNGFGRLLQVLLQLQVTCCIYYECGCKRVATGVMRHLCRPPKCVDARLDRGCIVVWELEEGKAHTVSAPRGLSNGTWENRVSNILTMANDPFSSN